MTAILSISLIGCSSSDSGSSGSTSAVIDTTYMISDNDYYESVGWYVNMDVMLVTYTDGTYELYYKEDTFGTTDPGIKGNKTIIYSGTFTSEESADGEASHLDLSLEAPTRIYFEQHGKAFGYNAYSGALLLDTANWTDDMTTVAFPSGSDDGAADFLAKYAQSMTITVEDPSLLPEDTSLTYRIVEASYDTLNITGDEE